MTAPQRPDWLWAENSYLPLGLPLGEQVRVYIEHLEAERDELKAHGEKMEQIASNYIARVAELEETVSRMTVEGFAAHNRIAELEASNKTLKLDYAKLVSIVERQSARIAELGHYISVARARGYIPLGWEPRPPEGGD